MTRESKRGERIAASLLCSSVSAVPNPAPFISTVCLYNLFIYFALHCTRVCHANTCIYFPSLKFTVEINNKQEC